MTAFGFDGLVAIAMGLTAATTVYAAPMSGVYGGLVLAVNGAHISGAFSEQRRGNGSDAAPQFSCEFLFHGRIYPGTSTAQLITASEDGNQAISGRIAFGLDAIKLGLNSEPDGCGMTSGDMVASPYEATRDAAGVGWIGAALVRASRVSLRRTPAAAPPAKPYLVRGDAVALLARRGVWVEVEFVGGSKSATGWLPASAVEEPESKPNRINPSKAPS